MAHLLMTARRIGVVSALVTAAAFGAVTSAEATPAGDADMRYPSQCHLWKDIVGATADCNAGSGQVRAITRCDKPLAPDYDVYGPWVNVPGESSANCKNGNRAFNQRMELR